MTIISKSLVGLGTIGTIGGVGAYAGGLFNSKEEKQDKTKIATIGKKLTEAGFKVLDTTKNDDWQAVLDEYKQAKERSFTKEKEENKTIEQLRGDCSKVINTDSKTDASYSLARQWCVKKEKMQDVFNRGKRKPLNFETPVVQEEETHWKTKIEILRKQQGKFTNVQITDSDDSLSNNITAIKAGCKALKIDSMMTTDNKFEENFKLAKDWCTIPTT